MLFNALAVMGWPEFQESLVPVIHLLGIILWIGGLMSLTRTLARHTGKPPSEAEHSVYLKVEWGLHNGAALPGLVLTLGAGIWALTAYAPEKLELGWFHAKLMIVFLFVVVHALSLNRLLTLRHGPPATGSPLFLALHILISALLIALLFLVKFQPF